MVEKVGISAAARLGEQLVHDGLISEEQLAEALIRQQEVGGRIGSALVAIGAISNSALAQALSRRLAVPGCVLRHGLIDPYVARTIPREEAEQLRVLPLFRVRDELTVAMVEPQSLPAVDRLTSLTGCRVRPVLVLEENLFEFQRKYMTEDVSVDAFLASMEQSEVRVDDLEAPEDGSVTDLDRMVEGSPVINLVNLAVLTALRAGASDLHIEPDRDATHVRCRVDGQLREILTPPRGLHPAIVSRIKVIGRMDIAEKRLPQEGRVHIIADGREIDLRASSMPTVLGEKVVLRILDRANINFDLSALGMADEDRRGVEAMVRSPYGLLLVTGPTGSGKTTTLYSCLDLLRSESRNLVTIEDPVEYQLPLVNQIQVNDRVGLSFVRALRSVLRQDPDVVMVGEIRDEETARVAIQAALTGHLVLSTLHTNDSPGAVVRLMDMGIEPYLISASVLGVVAQRLARRICPSCNTSHYPEPQLLEEVGWGHRASELFQKGEGCSACNHTGFAGRVGIYEVMMLDAQLKRMVPARPSESDIRVHLAQMGWRSLRAKALDLVEQKASTLEEVLRVTRSEAPDVAGAAAVEATCS